MVVYRNPWKAAHCIRVITRGRGSALKEARNFWILLIRFPVFLVLCVLYFDVLLYCPVLLSGKPLSHLSSLARWDYFWNSQRITSSWVHLYDPSLYWFCEPMRRVGRSFLAAGQNPLWCPSVGCGIPFLCNPEYRVLSPLKIGRAHV